MQLMTQPEDGVTPILEAIDRAKKTIDIVIFRFDLDGIEKALTAAVGRGVVVRRAPPTTWCATTASC